MPSAPSYAAAPKAEPLEIKLKTVTPILGGGAVTRELNEVDFVRVSGIRGQLRFWWRALYAGRYATPADLLVAESALWGKAADENGGRSRVILNVQDVRLSEVDRDDPTDDESYALWPSRRTRGENAQPTVPRRRPGLSFTLRVLGPAGHEADVLSSLRAWILFGGIGGRTRRGAGSLTVTDETDRWLPADPTEGAIRKLLGELPSGGPGDVARLSGASLCFGASSLDAHRAWTTSLSWLKIFRQGANVGREPGSGSRPSISRWPEPDKVRHSSVVRTAGRWAHPPRHNNVPVWPRAQFGLPIVGRFQDRSRQPDPMNPRRHLPWNQLAPGDPNYGDEPGPYTLMWKEPGPNGKIHDRLASPLIVKPLPLTRSEFAPCVLWLNRALPNGDVGMFTRGGSAGAPVAVTSSLASMALIADGGRIYHTELVGKTNVREAFLDWLKKEPGVASVTL